VKTDGGHDGETADCRKTGNRHGRQHGDMGLHRDIQPPGPIIHADRVNVTRGMMECCAYGKH